MNESTLVPREEMSDLDWLARNVHVWPEGKREVLVCWTRNVDTLIWSSVLSDAGWITKDQWLARRTELQNKPSWADAPEWAVALAQDSALEDGLGAWWWYEIEPTTCNRTWNNQGHAHPSILRGEVLGEWRDTLEKRPDANEMQGGGISESMQELRKKCGFDPLNSMEDAAPTTQPFSQKVSVDGVEYLITSASTSVNPSCAATTKQPDPKGSGNPILGMVLADLTNRALEGKEKYGEPLLAYNGRNPLWDAYQEALDLAMYLRQAIEEQK